LAALIYAGCRQQSLSLVSAWGIFLVSIAAWYAGELTAFPQALESFSPNKIQFAFACVLISVACFSFGYWLKAYRKPMTGRSVAFESLNDPDQLWRVLLLCMGIGLIPLLCIAKGNVLLILQDAFLPQKRWSSLFQRARYGDARDAFLELQMFLRAAGLLACVVVFSSRFQHSLGRRFLAATLLAYSAARALNSGSRLSVVEVFLPVAGAVFWLANDRWKRSLLVVVLPIAAGIAFMWSSATCVGRDAGQFEWKFALQARYTGFEMFRELAFLTTQVPERSRHLWGETYYVQVINPIPRFLWPEKPREDAGLMLARMQQQVWKGEPKLTIAPGLIGEMYWNFGLPGIAMLSSLIGWLCASWDHWGLSRADSLSAYLIYVSGLGILFMSGRSVNITNFYGLVALWLTSSCVRCFWPNKTSG
jgi:oligosaccharide repeat unit polymerase